MYGRRPTAREKMGMKKVYVNVSGLFVESCSPGHDEIRRVPVGRETQALFQQRYSKGNQRDQ